jgi:LmbE family N-acetylglucosaminyl deacetylase
VITAGELHERWRALPVGSLSDVIGAGACLVLAPHPDDESLGCGGLIAASCAARRPPLVVVLTDGSQSHPDSRLYPPRQLAALREAEAVEAVRILGLPAARLMFMREPDTKAPHSGPALDAVVRRLVVWLRAFGCSAIAAPWRHDPHCDHEASARIACEAAAISGITQVAYPIWGWMLAADAPIEEATVHGWRLDVTAHLPAKRRAIAAHLSQYGGLIADDPRGFQLPAQLLRAFDTPWETFLLP